MQLSKIGMSINSFIRHHWRDILALTPIIILACYMRLDSIRDYQVFLGDQGRDVLVVKRMIVDGDWTFIGPTASVGGFHLGPLYYYLMIVPLSLTALDPVGPAIMVALFSIATTVLVYGYSRKYINHAAAIISASIYAVSHLVVEYARSSWNPNILPFFVMILIWGWTSLLSKNAKKPLYWFFAIGVMLGSVIQLHYAALILIFMSVGLYIVYSTKEYLDTQASNFKSRIKEILVVILGFVVILSPFIGFEIKNNFPNTCGILRSTGLYEPIIKQNLLGQAFYNVGISKNFVSVCDRNLLGRSGEGIFENGYPFEFLVRDVSSRLFLRLVAGNQQGAMGVIYAVVATGILYGLYRLLASLILYVSNSQNKSTVLEYLAGYLRDSHYQKMIAVAIVIGMWWLFGVGWWGFYKKSIFDYYFSYMYPLPILTFGLASALIIHMYSRRLLRANYLIRIGKLALWGFCAWLVFTNFVSIRTVTKGEQVIRAEQVADDIILAKGPGEYNFALITEGNSDHAYRYFLEIKNHKPVSIDLRVTDQLMVLCEVDTRTQVCEPQGNPTWEVAGFGPATIVGEWKTIGWPLYRLQHLPEEKWRIGNSAQKGD